MSAARLAIVKGVPSPISLGFTGVTDPVPEMLDLLSDALYIMDDSGRSSWSPSVAAIKNGGVWADSSLSNGRVLTAAAAGNVIETMRLIVVGSGFAGKSTRQDQSKLAAGNLSKVAALTRLNRFAQAARDFWTTGAQNAPVYLLFHPTEAPAAQYALIYNIDISQELDPFVGDQNGIAALTIEREPFWRALPPGSNPKVFSFYAKNFQPSSVTGAPSGLTYNHQSLNLNSAFGSNQSLIEANVRNYDEIATANVNYIDIPADQIPGDAPCLALINFTAKANGASKVHIARSTRIDLFPANNTNNADGRARNTFNGGDISSGAPANPTVTKPTDATNGLLSNGSVVNRHVLQLAFAAGAVSGAIVGNWQRRINQYQGRYAAFLRGLVSAGDGSTLSFYLQYAVGVNNINLQTTPPTRLNQPSFGLTYLGVVDFTQLGNKLVGAAGLGLDTITDFVLRLGVIKTGALTPTFKVTDLVLMPIDEVGGMITVDFATLSNSDAAFMDSTGYFTGGKPDPIGVTRQSTSTFVRRLMGTAVTLRPGVNNRLYFLAEYAVPNVTIAHEARVDIIPCWWGIRDI